VFNDLVSALGGAGALTGLVAAIVAYLKIKAQSLEHDQQNTKIDAFAENLTKAQNETVIIRKERDDLRQEVIRLQSQIDCLKTLANF